MATRDQVYLKFGEVAEAAQLFETNLGTVILATRAVSESWHKKPDPNAARKVLESINRKTLGVLLNEVRKIITFDSNTEKLLIDALNARNELMHGFYEKHNFKIFNDDGCDEMISDLECLHSKLTFGWQSALSIADVISKSISNQTKKSAH